MTPNLFVALQTLSAPQKWFSHKKPRPVNVAPIEHWDAPIAGRYEYIPGDGWYLLLADDPAAVPHGESTPLRVVYSRFLKRWLLESELRERTRKAPLPAPTHRERDKDRDTLNSSSRQSITSSRPASSLSVPSTTISSSIAAVTSADPSATTTRTTSPRRSTGSRPTSSSRTSSHAPAEPVRFFRLDDGVTWVNDEDSRGRFVEGPYARYVLDAETGRFRAMRKGDDPAWREERRRSGVCVGVGVGVGVAGEGRTSWSDGRRESVQRVEELRGRSRPQSVRQGSSSLSFADALEDKKERR